jgi:Protein of unknown function (DUF2924)
MQPAGQDPEARLVPGMVTLPLCSRTNASPYQYNVIAGLGMTGSWNNPHLPARLTGRMSRSLSKVAFAITGSRWNGPRFFGLRDRAAPLPPLAAFSLVCASVGITSTCNAATAVAPISTARRFCSRLITGQAIYIISALKVGPPNFDVWVFDVRDRTHWRRRSDRAMMPEASLIFSLQC